jgi:hypothetical protein
MKVQITKNDIDYALGPSPWDLSNQVLYSLCQDHPRHDSDNAIIAKMLLIGRTYAAAVERRRNAEDSSDDFYTVNLVQKIKKSKLDTWLAALPRELHDPWRDLGLVITVHKRLLDVLFDLTGLEKRALASKYLHFHRPDLFFIYDSRAKTAITKVTPRINEIRDITCEQADDEYHMFCRRSQHCIENIRNNYGLTLTPRQIDRIFLRITDRIKKV